MRALKNALIGATALVAAAIVAAPASATSFDVSKITMNTTYQVGFHLAGGYNGNVYASPVTLTGTIDGTGPSVDLLAFCVDVFQESTLGNKSPALHYTLGTITDDSGGNVLSAYDQSRLNWLIDYGYHQTDAATRAEVQVGIWWLLDQSHGLTLTATSSFNASMLSAAKAFGDTTNTLSGTPLKWSNPDVQDYTAQGSVPEPASWALMFAGFGLIGSVLRSQRRSVKTAVSFAS